MANIVQIVLQGKDNFSGVLRGVTGQITGLKSALGAIGITAVSGAFVALANDAINTADEMGKLAQKAGIPVEAFSRLAFAAKLSNVETGQLSTSLRFLNKNLGEALVNPLSEAARTFRALGVEIVDARGKLLPTEEIIKRLADSFSGLEDSASKGALAQKAFGKSGAEILPLLNEAGDGIERMGARANVVTEDMAQKADAFKDNIDLLKTAFGKTGFVIAETVLPRLVSFTNALLDAETNFNAAQSAAEFFLSTIRVLAIGLAGIRQAFVQVGGAIALWIFTAEQVLQGLWRIIDGVFTRLEDRAKQFVVLLNRVVANMGVVGQAMKALLAGDFKEAGELAVKALRDGLSIGIDLGKAVIGTATDPFSAVKDATDKAGIEMRAGWKSIIDDMKAEAKGFDDFMVKMFLELAPKINPSIGKKDGGKGDAGDVLKQIEGEGEASQANILKISELRQKAKEDYLDGEAEIADLEGRKFDAMAIRHELELEKSNGVFQAQLENANRLAVHNSDFVDLAELAAAQHERNVVRIAKRAEVEKRQQRQVTASYTSDLLGQGAQLALQLGKEGFVAYQALSIGQAIINTALAVTRALADLGPIAGPIAAGVISALGAAQIGLIASQKPGGQAHGGLDYVPEESTFLLNRGERVLQPQANQDLTAFLEGSGGGGPTQIAIYLDGAILGQGIGQLSRDGRLEISAKAIAA